MKLKDFRKKMEKNIFTTTEAHLVAFQDNPKLINLQLYQWKKQGDLVQLKRGLYMFADSTPNTKEIAENLYSPCYISLEYALSMYGIIPEAVFSYTLVTPKLTRKFETPAGTFIYHKIKKQAFTGFDHETLLAEKEKALIDYFYLKGASFKPNEKFWEESRLEVTETDVNFKKVFQYAKLYKSKRLESLLDNFYSYVQSQKAHQ